MEWLNDYLLDNYFDYSSYEIHPDNAGNNRLMRNWIEFPVKKDEDDMKNFLHKNFDSFVTLEEDEEDEEDKYDDDEENESN